MTRRVVWIELMRGAAPVAAGGVLVLGGLSMYSLAGDWAGWAGRWMPFATCVRMSLYVIGAIGVAGAAWQGGRERRRRIGDQLVSTARPAWQLVLLDWATVTLGASVALLVLIAVGAALVAPVASYSGGGWWWVLAVAFPGLAALTALGYAVGRLVPSRLTAPVAGIGTYLLMVGAIDTPSLGGVRWLAPAMSQYDGPGYTLSGSVSAQQALWFAGLAGAALVLVAARRWWVLLPAAVALAGAYALVSEPVETWQPDLVSAEPVCADGTPNICVSRLNAFALDQVAVAARPVLDRWARVPGPEPRIEDGSVLPRPHDGDERVLHVQFDAEATLTGRVVEREGTSLFSWWPTIACDDPAHGRHAAVFEVTAAWGSGAAWSWLEPDRRAALESLEALPADTQGVWFTEAIEAARTCDEPTLHRLAEELT